MSPIWLSLLVACTSSEPETASDDSAAATDTEAPADDGGDSAAPGPCDGVTPEVTDLSSDQLAEMLLDEDFELINVHVPYGGEIAGTDAHIDYREIDELEAWLGGALDARAVLYCMTGPMSQEATEALVERGYCAIYDLPDGMVGWERDGYTLEP